jgi:hypothetical protein
MRNFLLSILAVLACFGLYHEVIHGQADETIAIVMFAVFCWVSLIMLPRRAWPARALGLFWTSVSSAALLAIIAFDTPLWLTDWLRAVYTVGGLCLAWGLTTYTIAHWGKPETALEMENGFHGTPSITTLTDRDFPTWPSNARPAAEPGEDGRL